MLRDYATLCFGERGKLFRVAFRCEKSAFSLPQLSQISRKSAYDFLCTSMPDLPSNLLTRASILSEALFRYLEDKFSIPRRKPAVSSRSCSLINLNFCLFRSPSTRLLDSIMEISLKRPRDDSPLEITLFSNEALSN